MTYVTRFRAALRCAPAVRVARLLTAVALVAAGPLAAQPTLLQRAAPPAQPGIPLVVDLGHGPAAPPATARGQVLRQTLALTTADEMRPVRTETDELGFSHERYQPYYQGVKVEHGTISLHARGGRIESLTGDYLRPAAGASANPALTAAAARQQALVAVGAKRYKWQEPAEEAFLKQQSHDPAATYFPAGELVWVGDFRQPEATRPVVLAWKFNVYAAEPVSRELIYVDARTGAVLLRDAVIKHLNAPGASFATRYLGARTSTTDNTGAGYRLRETVTGKGVTTLNLRKSQVFATAVDFVDNDNSWTAAEHNNANFDNAALDAHLGAQVTQDYWTNVHGRDSYDNQGTVLLSYVHYGNGIDNAYWNGTAMLYGDGSSLFKPLTAVDVCGHEIGHAVCATTANLTYSNESGALNEGLSDCWGASVENHLDPTKQIWLIGEDICLPSFGTALRSMSNPNQFGQPDTYKGTNWYTGTGDNGGVHTNSGVLNFWYYLLSQGGSGTNDFATTYNVTAITIQKAARILYRAERLYMTAATSYAGARVATMKAAIDLYGFGSPELTSVAQAWRAVGVGNSSGGTEGAPTITSFAPASGVPGTSVVLTGTNLSATYAITFNGAPATLGTITTATSVTVIVPPTATTGLISLTTPTGTATSASSFTITSTGPPPAITSFAPAAGQVQGGAVTITGTDFTGATSVRFNGASATILTNSGTVITTTVPGSATTGALTVTTPNGTATAAATFTVLPNVTSFAPPSGIVGAAVTLTGTSFTGALSVKLNGVYVSSYTVVNATTITTTVPVGATTGTLAVRTASGTATSATSFTVTPSLAFTGFSPTSGVVGAVISLQGTGFTGTTAVRFGGVNAPTFTVASDNEIWATVPAGAISGNIGLTTPLGPATSPSAFTVTIATPTIATFTPTSGPVGTAVTITGTYFTGATAVKFNGTNQPAFTVVNATTITTTVPAGATSGTISVTTPVGTAVSSAIFALPPTNDVCANAGLPALACGATVFGTTTGSTATGDPTAACNSLAISAAAGGVFYRFVGTGGSVTVSTCAAATDFDSQLFVFTGTCGAYTCVGSNDDQTGTCAANGATTPSAVTFASAVGTSYFIFVNGYNGAKGNFGLTATCAPVVPVVPTVTSFSPPSGLVGQSVSLTGTNFTTASGVTFNGTAAVSFTVNSASSISATVPVGATTGLIGVTTTSGGSGASATNFVVLQAPVIAPQTFSLPENSTAATAVGPVVATDPNVGETLAYAITAGNPGGAFALDASTGALTVASAAALDFETTPTFSLTVQVTDNGATPQSAAATVTVNLTNVNEAPATPTDANAAANTVAENAANGTAVGLTATATDPDASTTLTYALTDDAGGRFAINAATGVVMVANGSLLDFEAAASHSVTVRVSDGAFMASQSFSIAVTDVNEAPSIGAQSRSIAENSANGTNVGAALTATDPDGDALTYTITAGNPGGAFGFGANGQLQVASSAALDFETTPSYSLTVQVSDGALTATNTVTVSVTNVNEVPSISPQSRSIAENLANGSNVGAALTATDPDGDALTYAITAGNTGGAFSFTGNQLKVASSAALDFEATPSFALTVQVSDGTLAASNTVTVSLTNVNEAPSISPQTRGIAENSANGTNVGTALTGTDPDGDALTYTITAGNPGGAFSFTGNQLQVANVTMLDFETTPTFSLTVQVSDGTLTDNAVVTVNLTDVVEQAPDLLVAFPQPVAAGTYHDITVAIGGRAILSGAVTVTGTLRVQSGGTLDDGCQVISGAGTFVLEAGGQLNVCHPQGIASGGAAGLVQLTGTRTFAADAIYAYVGSQAQVTGTGLPANVRELVVNNAAGVTLTQAAGVTTVLRLTAGTLNTNAKTLTLRSTALRQAYAVHTAGTTSGNVTVERWVGTPATVSYRHLSSPVQSTTVTDLTVTGFTPKVNTTYNALPTPTLPAAQMPNCFGYDETRGGVTNTSFNTGYYSPASLGSVLTSGSGWSVSIAGNRAPDFVGALTTGNVSVALTLTGNPATNPKAGWHLVGNPYPQPINWDSYAAPTGLDGAAYVWYATGGSNGAYRTRLGGMGALANGLIGVGQGFWVRRNAAASASLDFTNALRADGNVALGRPVADARPRVQLTLAASAAPAGQADDVFVYAEAGATTGVDARYDALRPGPNVGLPTLSALIGGQEAMISGLPATALTNQAETVVELTATLPTPGAYALSVSSLANWGATSVELLDRLTSTRYALAQQPTLLLTATRANEAVTGRFALVINGQRTLGTAAPAVVAPLSVWPNPAAGPATVRVSGAAPAARLRLLDVAGRTVGTATASATGEATFATAGLPAGVYVVRVGAATQRLVIE